MSPSWFSVWCILKCFSVCGYLFCRYTGVLVKTVGECITFDSKKWLSAFSVPTFYTGGNILDPSTPEKSGNFRGVDYRQVIFKNWTEKQHQYVHKPSLKMWNFFSINTGTAQSEQSLVCSHCQWRPSQVQAQDPPAQIWWWGSGQPSSPSGWGQGQVLAEADMRAWSDQTECGRDSQRHSANASHGRYLGEVFKKNMHS